MDQNNMELNYEVAKELYDRVQKNRPKKFSKEVCLDGLQFLDNIDKNKLIYASIYLTHKCQIDCVYCSKHFDIHEVEEGKVDVLTKEDRLKFIREAKNLGLKTVIFQGMAEPTEDPDFKEYIEYADNLGIKSIVFTNILNLDEDLAEFLYNHNVSLAPSVDTLTREVYGFMTNSDKYDKFMRAIQVLKKYFGGKDKWIDGCRSRVLLSMVVTRYNIGDLEAIRNLCNEQGWLLCSKAFGVKGAASENFQELAVDKEYYSLLQSLAMAFADKVMITQTSEGKCACGGRKGILVDIDGKIGACGDTLTRVDANVRTNTVEECLKAKQDYVNGLGDYACLSKALRGFGDVNVAKSAN